MMQQAVDWSNIVCGAFTVYCAAALLAQAQKHRRDDEDDNDNDDSDTVA